MSDNKLLNENTVRRFMKLAKVDTLTDNFIQTNYSNKEEQTSEEVIEEQMEPEMEPEEPAAEMEPEEPAAEMDMDEEEPEMEMGAADISLTEEEAELLIDLGERLKEAMEDDVEDDMEDDIEDDMGDEPMADEAEEPMDADAPDTEDPAGYRAGPTMQENKDEIVKEVLRRVTKRILSNRR